MGIGAITLAGITAARISLLWRSKCPEGAFITLLHGGEWQKALVLEILDEAGARAEGLNRFFGIPFRFLNV